MSNITSLLFFLYSLTSIIFFYGVRDFYTILIDREREKYTGCSGTILTTFDYRQYLVFVEVPFLQEWIVWDSEYYFFFEHLFYYFCFILVKS